MARWGHVDQKTLNTELDEDPQNPQKNAPSLAVGGKSTFSEGGGDNRCVQKSTTVQNCNGDFVAMQQVA